MHRDKEKQMTEYTGTTPNGTTISCNSKTRRYTHAVWVETAEGQGSYSFHSNLELAHKAADRAASEEEWQHWWDEEGRNHTRRVGRRFSDVGVVRLTAK